MLPYQLQIVYLMAISLAQLGNVRHSIATNIQSFMLQHHPVLVGSCIIILLFQFKSIERCKSTKLEK